MKLHIGNLPYEITQAELERLFKKYSPSRIEIIIDLKTKRSRGFGFVTIDDDNMANNAIIKLNGQSVRGRNIRVSIAKERRQERGNRDTLRHIENNTANPIQIDNTFFPYDFYKRRNKRIDNSKLKQIPVQYHDSLNNNCYDIAFEIEWTTLTPVAVNPCRDATVSENPEDCNEGDYAGYNRRWLMIDNRLAISPFTVKSAIANGFANLMGGCYRVNTKVEGHKDITQGKYPYGGKYKRYRVAMDGSKPGIIKKIETISNNDREIEIQPVKEYYCNSKPENLQLQAGKEYHAIIVNNRGHKPPIIKIVSNHQDDSIMVKYHGEYHYGMNLSDPRGTKHKYRFYTEEGSIKKGVIKAENFMNREDMQKIVYLGGHDQNNNEIPLWYEDLNSLDTGDFVYYEEFNNKITNIGKNFLFKALFLHEDTVPEENSECKDINCLCPRCSMFGMTDKTGSEDREAIGFKGRFKSATLLSDKELKEDVEYATIPVLRNRSVIDEKITIKKWTYNGEEISRQYLLPIQQTPKPNKRDIDGYFDSDSGEIKGAKYYLHAHLDLGELIKATDNKKGITNDGKTEYAHNLRNFAQVCKEGITFRGTVGAENCSIDEISALILLLHTPLSSYGFKIGLGKAFGMGSIKSEIKKVWIRDKSYEWKSYNNIEELLEKS